MGEWTGWLDAWVKDGYLPSIYHLPPPMVDGDDLSGLQCDSLVSAPGSAFFLLCDLRQATSSFPSLSFLACRREGILIAVFPSSCRN